MCSKSKEIDVKKKKKNIAHNINTHFLKKRTVFLNEPITDVVAKTIVTHLLFFDDQDSKEDIIFYINSGGGVVTAGMAIYDVMQFISCDVVTICTGQAGSMAAILLAAGAKGKRYSLPNSRVMIHQPKAGCVGQVTDIEIHANEALRIKKYVEDLLVKHTGQSKRKISEDTDRDKFMTSQDAKDYGIVDKIITYRKNLPK